jgi:hypothetical protein
VETEKKRERKKKKEKRKTGYRTPTITFFLLQASYKIIILVNTKPTAQKNNIKGRTK